MNRKRPLLHFLLALLVCGAAAAFAVQRPTAPHGLIGKGSPSASSSGVPRLNYRERTLSNGLTVYSVENHNSPTVAIQVWYRVGGKNDPENKSGFAHLFEHLMFKSTRNMKSEMMDQLTEYVGGENNAYTTEDRTVYHETVPSNYTETLLWAEADRMANLNVDEPDFISERAVVEEEYRQSVLAPPYGRMYEYVSQHSFARHPYRRGVIGSITDLDSANIEDVRQFHRTFYRPDNAVLIVTGDFEPAKLDTWVDKYFGRIARPAGEVPRIAVQEPARTGEKRFTETGPNVPLSAVVINYLVPPASSADAAPLHVAAMLLSRGDSSRLYQSLVYKQQIASSAYASADMRADTGLFQFVSIAAGGKSIDAVESATLAEADLLQTTAVSAQELEKARNQLMADALRRRETASGEAAALGEAAVTLGDPERVNTDIDRLQSVTAADVQRVAKEYFTPENRVVVRYEAGSQEQGGISHAAVPQSAPPVSKSAPAETPPLPAAPRRAVYPTPVEKTLPNGLRIVVVPRGGTGLVSVVVATKAGASEDPENAAGVADFTASLLTRGTTTRSATQIAQAVEDLGGSLNSGAGWDSSTVTLSVMSSRLEDALPICADVVRNPAFAAEEVSRLRTESLDGLAISLRSPGALAQSVAARVVFGDTAYGHTLAGTPESIKAIDRSSVTRFYQSRYLPKRTAMIFSGDIPPAVAFDLAARYFGDWNAAAPVGVELAARVVVPSQSMRVIVVDKPDAGQAAVVMARPGIRRADPQYSLARVANGIFGEGYSSRINQEIRIKRGLSYGASSRFDARREGGLFSASAQTRNNAVPEVASLLQEELARMSADSVPAVELAARKANLTGNYSRRLETGGGLAAAVADLTANDLPLSMLSAFPRRVLAVTSSQVRAFAAQRLNPEQSSIIIVGDSRQFLPALRQKFSNVEVIPISQLDLNSGRLWKP
jgi:zinc protease